MPHGAVPGLVLALALVMAGAAAAQTVDDISHNQALVHYRLGEELIHREQFAKAADEFQAAITLDPLLTIAHYELGQAYMALRRYVEAIGAYVRCRTAFETLAAMVARNDFDADQRRDDEIRELNQTIGEIRSGHIRVSTGRDAMIARLEHRISELERTKQRSTTSYETPAEVSLVLGSAYFRSRDLVSAEREWKAAIAANNRLGEAHNNLAALYAMTGRKQRGGGSRQASRRVRLRGEPEAEVGYPRAAAGIRQSVD